MAKEFITEDSGYREAFPSGFVRDVQEGKPRHDLLYFDGLPYEDQPLTRWAALMARGAEKYGEKNFLLASSAEELTRFRASAARHFAQFMSGEKDEDHFSATAFNMSMIIYLEHKLNDENLSR